MIESVISVTLSNVYKHKDEKEYILPIYLEI